MDVIEKIKNICDLLDELDEYFDNIPNKQSENDQAISDLYHYIENNRVSTKGSYRIVKELKEHLAIRRILKEDHEFSRTFNSHKTKLYTSDNRKFLIAELKKTEKRLTAPYSYRIYESEEFLRERIEH